MIYIMISKAFRYLRFIVCKRKKNNYSKYLTKLLRYICMYFVITHTISGENIIPIYIYILFYAILFFDTNHILLS